MRRPIIAGNWKMYKTRSETCVFFEKFKPLVANSDHCEIVICPTFVNLEAAVGVVRGTRIRIGGQNLFWAKEGAYTGEISAPMLKCIGAEWVLVAHSERRHIFGETDEGAAKKTIAAIEGGLTPILCVGEVLAQREAGQTNAILQKQCQGGFCGLTPEQFSKIAIAYEPVWAIGTGKTATPQIASEAHRVIRAEVSRVFGAAAAEDCRVLYGGSVKPDNIKGLMDEPEIDGVLVGGASLDAGSFGAIVNYL